MRARDAMEIRVGFASCTTSFGKLMHTHSTTRTSTRAVRAYHDAWRLSALPLGVGPWALACPSVFGTSYTIMVGLAVSRFHPAKSPLGSRDRLRKTKSWGPCWLHRPYAVSHKRGVTRRRRPLIADSLHRRDPPSATAHHPSQAEPAQCALHTRSTAAADRRGFLHAQVT